MVVTYCFKDIIIINVIIINVIVINVIIIIYLSYIILKKSKSICLLEIRTCICRMGLRCLGQ